ncbi:MAG: universal stress protein [Planctomycetes bacterium]|nr:universal stress protein [Planctomycetota bacterium]
MNQFELLDAPVRGRASASAWKRILLPLDGSELSKWALARARHILEQPGTSVTLLRVIECEEARANDLSFRMDPRHRKAGEALARTRINLLDLSVSASSELRFGDPVTEILREIAEGGHDLVVMSTHGQTWLSRVFLGSVAERVLQSSPVPLLLFRPMMGPDETLSFVETREAASFKRLLVVLDGLEPAEEILPMAEGVARAFGSELHLFGAIFGGSQEAAKRREAEEYFKNCAASLAERGIPSQVHVCMGTVAEEALALIRERALDSVALMTHGRAGLARAIHGSVAQRLIRESGVPVLVLRNRRLRPLPSAMVSGHRQLWVD